MDEISKGQELLMANLIYPLIKDLALPKIQAVTKILSKEDKLYSSQNYKVKALDALEDYLTNRYLEFSILDTLSFPNMQTLFDVLYEPLSIFTVDSKGQEVSSKIDEFPEEVLNNYYRILIEDSAGMGKSTITKKIFRSAIEQKKNIPIHIDLKNISKEKSIIEEIISQLSPINEKFSEEYFLLLLNQSGFLFIFDGYDEISNYNRDYVNKEIRFFLTNAKDNLFIITSRPEENLSSFGDFKKFHIKQLSKKEAYNLLERYDYYNYKNISRFLIEEINSHDDSISSFLGNPLLVTLLFKAYDYKKNIPLKKIEFYRQIFEALFEAHDLSKAGYYRRDKYSSLSIDDFDKVLRYLAFKTLKQNSVIYDKDYLLMLIEEVKGQIPNLKFKANNFIKDLLETVPIFKKEGTDIRWSHKSLQEYFAAKFLWIDTKESQESILRKIYSDDNNDRLRNFFTLFCEIDPNTFECTILYWILKDFKDFYEDLLHDFSDYSHELIQERAIVSFNRICEIIIVDDVNFIYDFNRYYMLVQEVGVFDAEKKFTSKNINENWNKILLEAVKKSIDENLILLSHSVYGYDNALIFFKGQKNINNIFKIIVDKYPEMVQAASISLIPERLSDFEKYAFIDLTNDINDFKNSRSYFDTVNKMLSQDIMFVYEGVMRKLNSIEQNKRSLGASSFLSW
jgi:hypothetical protein